MNDEMQFTLKELRARRNITQKRVSSDLGISVQTYNAWEKDVSNVAASKVQAIADYYGVKIGEIFLPSYMKKNHVNESDRK